MINVNKITSTLAKLPDQQLQQYAQMHKSDPYIMALAMSESNRRKEMRSAGQGAQGMQGMQEQPKVVDSEIAQMAPQQLPEDMGIGQLNAGEMNFAGGGIIAFADGGDVERYAGGGDLLRTTTGGKSWFLDVPSTMRDPSVPYYREIPSPFVGLADKQFATKEEALAAYNQLAPAATPAAAPKVTPVGAPARSGTMPEPGYTRPGMLYDPRLNTPPTQPVKAAPTADTTRKGPGAGPAAAAAGPKAASADQETAGLDSLINRFTRQSDLATGAAKNARAELAAKTEQIPKDRAERNRKELEAEGDVYKSREDRLAAREKGLEGMGDKYLGLALLQAGAAMMSTPGALGAVLGKGIQVGSERYVAGIDKINAAKEKFADARERLDDLRLNRSDMTKKQIRDDQREIDNAQIQAKKLLSDGLDNDLKISNDNQKAIFGVVASSLETDKRIGSAERIAAINEGGANARSAAQIAATLNTPDRVLFDQLMKKNGNDAVKALEAFKVAKGDKFDVRSSYADYLKAFAGKEGLTPPMSMGAYAGQFGATLPR